MSRREVSRPPVRAVFRAVMAPESGADMVPLAAAPVPGRPGGTDSGDRLTPDVRRDPRLATGAGSIIVESAGSHAIYISKAEAVATLIAKAAKNVNSQMAAWA